MITCKVLINPHLSNHFRIIPDHFFGNHKISEFLTQLLNRMAELCKKFDLFLLVEVKLDIILIQFVNLLCEHD